MRNIRRFTAGSTPLQIIEEGEGIPTLVIGSALYYDRVFSQSLRSSFRFAFVDHRGFAPPDPSLDVATVTLQSIAEDVESARIALGWDQFVLIGHSGHAFMALEYAKRCPANVTHLVLMNVSPDYHARSQEIANRHFEEHAEPERRLAFQRKMELLPAQIAEAPERAFALFNVASGPKGWYDFAFDATPLWADVPTNMPLIDHIWGRLFHDIDILEGVEHLKAPILLVLGRHDYIVPPAYLWDEIRDRFLDMNTLVFENSAHAPMYEEHELFDRELLRWIEVVRMRNGSESP